MGTLTRPSLKILSLVAVAAAFGGLSHDARADVLFQETFDTDVADTLAFEAAYPAFVVSGNADLPVTVSDGKVVITNTDGGNVFTNAKVAGIGGDVTYSIDIGSSNSNGSYNVGFELGQNRIVFHPGFPAGGALRVTGPGGFGNQDMGFVPANGTLHHLEVKQTAASGLFELTLTDGDNPANVYTNSFTNLASVGAPFGPVRDGPTGETGIFDNLVVEDGNTSDLKITEILLLPDNRISLTWNSRTGASYALFWGTDLVEFLTEVDDFIGSEGETTTFEFDDPSVDIDHPQGLPRVFFRIVEN